MNVVELRTIKKQEIAKVSSFISKLNNNESSHIGFCGKDRDEIANYMVEEISDVKYTDSFIVAYDNKQLVGVLGFEADFENSNAEIWGPFILPDNWDIAFDLWAKMLEKLPDEINELEMFPNVKNTRLCDLAKSLTFQKYSDETILTFQKSNSHALKSSLVKELTPAYILNMKQLHDKAFPGAYYSGQQMMNRLNENRKVFITTTENKLSGYIYVEAEPEFGEGSIEFFAVEESERGQGIGAQLLTGALEWLFTFESMEDITLCVNTANENAIKLYKKVGFQHEHDLCSFTKKIR